MVCGESHVLVPIPEKWEGFLNMSSNPLAEGPWLRKQIKLIGDLVYLEQGWPTNERLRAALFTVTSQGNIKLMGTQEHHLHSFLSLDNILLNTPDLAGGMVNVIFKRCFQISYLLHLTFPRSGVASSSKSIALK